MEDNENFKSNLSKNNNERKKSKKNINKKYKKGKYSNSDEENLSEHFNDNFTIDDENINTVLTKATTTTTTTVSIGMGRKIINEKDKDKKLKRASLKERWLLTRKTWKYMTDAGRNLIPSGIVHNRQEDIPKIEEYYQQICKSEPRFILWKRKSSFPGARGTSSRRLRIPEKVTKLRNYRSIDESLDETKSQTRNADIVLNILRDYLGISDNSRGTTALLGTNTSRPDSTDSPSSQRPIKSQINIPSTSYISHHKFDKSDTSSSKYIELEQQQQKARETQIQISELLERLRSYTQSMSKPIIPPERINTDILEDKALLKRIYTELKKQQLHRILGKHPTRSPLHLPHSPSLSSLWHFRRDGTRDYKTEHKIPLTEITVSSDGFTKGSDNLQYPTSPIPLILVKKPSCEKTYSSLGTQTDFIPLDEVQRLAKEYEEKKKEEEHTRATTDEESEKGQSHSRRKSSIDNEDVSQSVSDTIKRYLRMARKKSVHDDHANRFKRVNYDRNLRSIQAKGEINPPGMDEDNNKAIQTLDSWSLLLINYIRGIDNPKLLEDSHSDWQANLQDRIKRKQDYDEQQKIRLQEEQQKESNSPSIYSAKQSHRQLSAPTTTTTTITSTTTTTATMQKSKSSSNVGQFVSKKIWRSRSRSQTRTASPIKSEWTPQGNCVWTTPAGKRVVLSDVRLQDLTEIERKILHRVAVEKINQLNIGINVTAPNEVSNSNTETTQKKRRPLLIKRKALTTSFFDTGKKTEDKGGGSGLVFGVSLEKCVNNDSRAQNVKSTSSTTGLDRGSRNSIASLLDSSSKGGENIGSCESLPSHSSATAGPHSASRRISDDINTFGYQSGISDQMSRSQIDFHRLSQDEDELLASAPPMVGSTRNNGQQVPALVTACINHLEDHGMHTVGIFRVSTSKKRVRQLREDFDKGEISTLDPDICPHDVATILKEYLRDLPEPLLCKNLYKAFVKTQKIRNRRLQLEALSHLIQLLPVAHRDTLYVLLRFLAKIVRSSDDITSRDGTVLSVGNKMDSNNLATVFAPNILRYSSPGRNTAEQEIDEQIDVINVIRTMIDHYEELFRVPAELVDEIYTNMMDSHPQQLNYLCEKRDLLEKYDANNTTSGSSTTGSISLVASSPSISSPISDQSSTRRVYSREDFLHENAAKCETNGNISKRRERSSKTKHQETEEIAGRRHRRDRYISDGTTSGGKHQYPMRTNEGVIRNSSGDSVNQINLQQQKQLQEQQDSSFKSMSRRLSSPHVLQNTNIVTASLMIPVQVQSNNNIDQKQQQQQQQQQQINPHLNHNYTGQLDLQDIPFIEDEGALSSSYVYNEPVKGSISLRGKSDIRKDHQSAEVTQTQKSSYSSSVFNRGKGDGVAQLTTQNKQSQSHSSEPKISTSIMNIGGAVLRSKTADFERISNQQTKKSQQPTNIESVTSSSSGQIITGSSSAAPPSSASSSSLNENVKTRRSSQGPVYKRQELISSAKSK